MMFKIITYTIFLTNENIINKILIIACTCRLVQSKKRKETTIAYVISHKYLQSEELSERTKKSISQFIYSYTSIESVIKYYFEIQN